MAFTDDELLATIRGGESDRVEFTESTRDLDKFREAICAFANDLPDHRKPGLLFVGVRDDGGFAGLTVDDKLLTNLGGLRDDGGILPLPSMSVEKRKLGGCEVAVVQVEPSNNPPVKVNGRCWIRIGPRRGQASAEDERRLIEKRRGGDVPFDRQGVTGSTVENDVDMRRFRQEYLPAAVSAEVLAKNARESRAQLTALRLTTAAGTPTVAALLMLGKDPGYWFPGAYIQFVRYDGLEITDPVADQKKFHGTLPDQIIELEKMLVVHNRVALDMSAPRHAELPDYPLLALNEIARNAVIHRNYQGTNAPVRVYWYADRVEISNPGAVYGRVTPENFGSGETDYRNPTIAGMMKELGFMQSFGMGITLARAALHKNGNPEPQFDHGDTSTFATIKIRR